MVLVRVATTIGRQHVITETHRITVPNTKNFDNLHMRFWDRLISNLEILLECVGKLSINLQRLCTTENTN